MTLATEKAQTSPGTIAANQGTTRGIAGILVNTDTTDFVKNYGDIKEDNDGIYVTDLIEHQELQEQFDTLQYFKTIENFVNAFDLEYLITQRDCEYYARVIEDDNNRVFSLIYQGNKGNINDVVEIRSGDIFE